MKEKKSFMIEFVIGVILIGVGLILQVDYYSSMLFAMGCGLADNRNGIFAFYSPMRSRNHGISCIIYHLYFQNLL